MIRRKYANMRIYEDNIDFADVENAITYSLSAKNLENNLNKREEELFNKIADLEAKLAESEKERELDNSFWKQECDSLQKTLFEKDKEIDNLYDRLNSKQKFYEMSLEKDYKEYLSRLDKLEKQCDKDKISFAVEQLEKVLKILEEKQFYKKEDTAYCVHPAQIAEYIDNQIEELKKEMK